MKAERDHHPDNRGGSGTVPLPSGRLLGPGIPYTASRTSEIVTYSRQEYAIVPRTFRITALVDHIPHLFPLGAGGLGHGHTIPERGGRALEKDRSRPRILGPDSQNHEESARRRRKTSTVVIEAQQSIFVRQSEALVSLRHHTPVVAGPGHGPSRRARRHTSVSRGSLIEASGSPCWQALAHSVRPTGAATYYAPGAFASTPRTGHAKHSRLPIYRKNGEKIPLPTVWSTRRVACVTKSGGVGVSILVLCGLGVGLDLGRRG